MAGQEGTGGKRLRALLFFNLDARMQWGGERHGPAALPARKRPGNHGTESWVGPRYQYGRARNMSHPPVLEPRTVTIPTELSLNDGHNK